MGSESSKSQKACYKPLSLNSLIMNNNNKSQKAKFEEMFIDVVINYENLPEDYIQILVGNEPPYRHLVVDEVTHSKLGWKFKFFRGQLSQNKNNILNYIKNENGEKRKKAAIICYVDDISSSQVEDFLNSLKIYSRIVLVTKKSANETEEPKIKLKKRAKIEVEDISIIKYEDNPVGVLFELLNISNYFNELGDDFVFPPLNFLSAENEEQLIQRPKNEYKPKLPASLNIVVAGQPGSGKSTFVNKLLGKRKALSSAYGLPKTKKFTRYQHSDFPISIYDTPGFNNNDGERTKDLIEKLDEFFEKIDSINDSIHLAVYVVNINSDRSLTGDDIDFLGKIIKKKVKLHILFTKCSKEDKEDNEDIKNQFQEDLYDELKEAKDYEIGFHFVNMKEEEDKPVFGLDEFYEALYNQFKGEKIDISLMNSHNYIRLVRSSFFFEKINRLADILKRNETIAFSIVFSTTLAAFAVGFCPIPFSDALILTPIQLGMVTSIAAIYGRYKSFEDVKSIAASGTLTICNLGLGKFIGGFIKFIPGIGTIAGGAICSAIASGTTLSMGGATISLLSKELKEYGEYNVFRDYAEKYNQAVDSLKDLSAQFSSSG